MEGNIYGLTDVYSLKHTLIWSINVIKFEYYVENRDFKTCLFKQ